MINSPRSLEACERIGIKPSELYQLSHEDFKNKYPDVISVSEKIYQYRYDAEEKLRLDTVKQVKEERLKIIEEKEKEKEESKSKDNENELNNSEEKWDKIIENEKKTIEKIQKKQKQDIESLIQEQIKKELMKKLAEAKETIKKEKDEAAERQKQEKKIIEENDRKEKEKRREEGLKKQRDNFYTYTVSSSARAYAVA